MFGSTALEIGIGLMLVYLLLSLVCTSVNELISQMFTLRGRMLRRALETMFEKRVDNFYQHALVKPLQRNGVDRPSYIPARVFARVVLDPQSRDTIVEPNSDIDRVIQLSLVNARADYDKQVEELEIWYNDVMDRVSGWYKRRTQTILFVLGMSIAFAGNVDTLLIAQALSRNPLLRGDLADLAQKSIADPAIQAQVKTARPPTAPPADTGLAASVTPDTIAADTTAAGTPPADESAPLDSLQAAHQRVQDNANAVRAMDLPIGWMRHPVTKGFHGTRTFPADESWLSKIVGLLLTGFALMLGAPFWFDVLNRFINVRSAGKSPRETPRPPENVGEPVPAPPRGAGELSGIGEGTPPESGLAPTA